MSLNTNPLTESAGRRLVPFNRPARQDPEPDARYGCRSAFVERCGDLETSIGEVRDLWETGSGQVQQILPELLEWLESHGPEPGQTLDEKHPHKAVHDAHRYLRNNASRRDYGRYRQQGLPVMSAPMESLAKPMNLRVKGTEMF